MRSILIFSGLLLYSCSFFSQENKVDTVFFRLDRFKKIDRIIINNVVFKNDTFCLTKKIDKEKENGKALLNKHKSMYSYFIFITTTGKRIEEGQWNGEHFVIGIYKEYYKNGNLKMAGDMDDGNKIGNWRYYNKNGTIKKEVNY